MSKYNKKLYKFNHKDTTIDTNAKINWVYGNSFFSLISGFRCHDVKNSLIYIPENEEKKISEHMIYFTACIVIIYYPKLNQQK